MLNTTDEIISTLSFYYLGNASLILSHIMISHQSSKIPSCEIALFFIQNWPAVLPAID
jgi:hypothetical protein